MSPATFQFSAGLVSSSGDVNERQAEIHSSDILYPPYPPTPEPYRIKRHPIGATQCSS
jgi:hypothetical protein